MRTRNKYSQISHGLAIHGPMHQFYPKTPRQRYPEKMKRNETG